MPRRKSTIRPFQIARIYLAPAGGLLLWLGVYAAAWFSVDNLAPERLSNTPPQAVMVQDRQQSDEPDASPRAAVSKGGNEPIRVDRSDSAEPQTAAEKPSIPNPTQSTPRNPLNLQENMTLPPSTAAPAPSPAPLADERAAERPVEKEENDDPKSSQQRVAAAETNGTSDNESDNGPESATTETSQPPASAKPETPPDSPHIARAQLTSGISQREPIDRVDGTFYTEQKSLRRIYYFTEIQGLRGETVIHNWWHEGRLIAKVRFRIGSNSWRVYSSKKLIPSMTGPWRVIVTDSQGNTLSAARFDYKDS